MCGEVIGRGGRGRGGRPADPSSRNHHGVDTATSVSVTAVSVSMSMPDEVYDPKPRNEAARAAIIF